jgi:predicted nucleic acid-binding Zn ribbon protein
MPTYTYKREDGSVFEIEQRITADALGTCPTTGQAVTRVITGGSGLVFKGSGFYLTDYARKKSSGGPSSENGESKSAANKDGKESSSKTSESSDSKPAKASSSDSKGSSGSTKSSGGKTE